MANNPHHAQNGSTPSQIAVVMVPFPAQGHLSQILQLSALISATSTPVHFVGTTTSNRQAKSRIHGLNSNDIHFHEFQTPKFLSPPPNPNSSIKFPSHLQPSMDSSLHLREPVAKLLLSLSQTVKRVVVIHDALVTSVVQDVVSIPNAEAYMFRPLSVFAFYCKYIEKTETVLAKHVPSLEGCFSSDFVKYLLYQYSLQNFHSGVLYDSSPVIEGKYLDFLTEEEGGGKIKHWGIGPFNPVEITKDLDLKARHKALEWLDLQDENSVIYISFGTTTCFSDEQILELAIGLEKSEQKFVWVLRDADVGDVSGGKGDRRIELPKGYEERVAGKGIVLRDWAPQLDILRHASTGGFMSHCGWNSCMESIIMGVPMATWPMHSDQPRNAVLITKVLKVGIVLQEWERRDELVTSVMIEDGVRRLMDSKEGEETRRRAEKLGDDVRKSVAEGGSARIEFDNFIAHITR